MHVGVLTGGGDVPGLNAFLFAASCELSRMGHRLLGIRRGWHGLVAVEPGSPASEREHSLPLTPAVLRHMSGVGGTLLHSSRTNPARIQATGGAQTYDATDTVMRNIEALGLDALLVVGGDDTLGFGEQLHRRGVPVIGVPKTMDNDVGGTDVCLGFATCVERTVSYLQQLRTPAASHERLLVVEVMGRNSGASCLWPALLAESERALIAEVPADAAHLAHLLAVDRAASPVQSAMVVVSEGARLVDGQVQQGGPEDAYGHQKLGGIGAVVARELKSRTGLGVMEQRLGYLVRAGAPTSTDILLAHGFASVVMTLLTSNQFGRLVGLQQGRYGHVPLAAVRGAAGLDVDSCYDAAALKPRLTSSLGRGLWPLAWRGQPAEGG